MEASANELFQRHRFEQIYIEFHRPLFRYVFALTRNQGDAEDLTQSAFLRLISAMARANWTLEIENAGGYLWIIAIRQVIDLWKARSEVVVMSTDDESNTQVHDELERKAQASDDFAKRLENDIRCRELCDAIPLKVILHGFSDEDRRLIYLNRIEERSPTEIAELLDLDVAALRYRLNKLNSRIRGRARALVTNALTVSY